MKSRILVVDDNPNNLYLMETLLKGTGHRPVLAADGEDALRKLRTDSFDLIVSDILMPNMDGFQLCRECKSNPKLRSIPFLFCTATYTDDKDERLAKTLGADKYVRKPIDPDALLRVIEELLANGRSKRPQPVVPSEDEQALLLYNQRLVEKLEGKMLDLDASETALKKTAAELRKQKRILQDKNTALKEILSQIEQEKAEVSRKVNTNVTELVMPIIRKLRRSASNENTAKLDLLERTLADLTSSFASDAGHGTQGLTLRQIEICNMIKSGMTSKDIAGQLGVSLRTIETHRNNIRRKLGISGEDTNLASYLQSCQ